MAVVHLPLLPVGLPEDGQVSEHHYSARYPEGDAAADHGIGFVHAKLAELRVHLDPLQVLVGGVPPEEDRNETDDGGTNPRVQKHERHHPLSHRDVVLERLDYRVVPIHTDAAQMQNGRRGKVNVQRVPYVTHEPSEQPRLENLHARVERHREHSDQHVRQGQRDHVVVRDYPQLPMAHHRHYH